MQKYRIRANNKNILLQILTLCIFYLYYGLGQKVRGVESMRYILFFNSLAHSDSVELLRFHARPGFAAGYPVAIGEHAPDPLERPEPEGVQPHAAEGLLDEKHDK